MNRSPKFRAHGLIVNEGAKMSKSRGNVIVPDALIEKYGADTVRLYLMFLGPFEQGGDYRDQGIVGPHGFLSRLWQSVLEAQDGAPDPIVERKLHQTIRQVTEQIPNLGYNTSIAAMMEYLNVVRARRAHAAPRRSGTVGGVARAVRAAHRGRVVSAARPQRRIVR